MRRPAPALARQLTRVRDVELGSEEDFNFKSEGAQTATERRERLVREREGEARCFRFALHPGKPTAMSDSVSAQTAKRARIGVATLILTIALAAAVICWHRGADARRYWTRLEERSLVVAREFLEAAARGDSAALATMASDSMVVWLRREGVPPEMGAMAAAAGQFERNRPDPGYTFTAPGR